MFQWRTEENIVPVIGIVMSLNRINAYHVMWLFVFFDLPVQTKQQRKQATQFRKALEKDGFTMMQFSVYVRHCPSKENMEVHVKRVRLALPNTGQVSILSVTDKQYSEIRNYLGAVEKAKLQVPQQLELF